MESEDKKCSLEREFPSAFIKISELGESIIIVLTWSLISCVAAYCMVATRLPAAGLTTHA
jgi:hypothetical protein